ncbi:MAG TPA: hypothetical protein VMZ53_00070, partial [Kofleriaceae bacterium]|nr:hypothetical protein [Kofleriaceae bacterium]
MSETPTPIGESSTIFLIYSYEAEGAGPDFDLDAFERQLCANDRWNLKRLDDTALLPHLDAIREGQLLRRYYVGSQLGNLFSERDGPWTLHGEGSAKVQVRISEAPSVYAFETGYVFIAIGVQPVDADLATYQNTLNALVRRGVHGLREGSLPKQANAWTEKHAASARTLRTWLAALVPALKLLIPEGGRENPVSVGALFCETPLDALDRHRLRLAQAHSQDIPPSEHDARTQDHPAIWCPSANEMCLFSSLGVQWVIKPSVPFLRNNLLGMIGSSYLYKWMLVAHQRIYLLRLTSSAVEVSRRGGVQGADRLRVALLRYTAVINCGHISDEERHDQFYGAIRRALDIEGLYEEAKEEITEIHEHAGARQAERINHVLAFLTIVLTPIGMVVGIFQGDTLPWPPGQFKLGYLFSWSGWSKLLDHGPFRLLLLCAVIGVALFLFFR